MDVFNYAISCIQTVFFVSYLIMHKIRKAYVFRLKTNDKIELKLSGFCGSGRFLWNKCVALNLDRLEKGQPLLWYNELAFWLTLWKQSDEYSFLKECP